mmetsp:Transcript_42786/g.93042  ORF Transcript_42786/g.93042 Transcript_42786/m.93042 type:complete len:82 (-) Transcript_42786:799-1044(-)
MDIYMQSILYCYIMFKRTYHKTLDSFDHFCLHSPFTKMCYKSVEILLYYEYISAKTKEEKVSVEEFFWDEEGNILFEAFEK